MNIKYFQRLLFLWSIFCILFAGFQIFNEPAWASDTDILSSEIIRTENFEIHFSPKGAVPVLWYLVDESFSLDKPAMDRKQDKKQDKKQKISLICQRSGVYEIGKFLEIILFPLNEEIDDHFNSMTYMISRVDETDFFSIQFDSPVGKSGLQIRKTYRVPHRGFGVELTVTLTNKSTTELLFGKEQHGLGILLSAGPDWVQKLGERDRHGPLEFVYKTKKKIESIRLEGKKKPIDFPDYDSGIEWAGFHSRYFMVCIIPTTIQAEARNKRSVKFPVDFHITKPKLTTEKDNLNYPNLEILEAPFSIGPGESVEYSYVIFGGPKSRKILRASSYGLENILFQNLWSWLRVLCLALMSLLGWLYLVCKNWGMAIIALSILMRTITFPVSRYGIKQQKIFKEQQAKLKPLIDEINKKYKDDTDKSYDETMKLYREHGVSPFASFKGCLWLLVQLPIFIALYQILSQSFEIRGESFLWIQDLSQPEMLFALGVTLPFIGGYFNFLPVLMAFVQLIQSYMMNKSSSSDTDNQQSGNKWIYILPITMMVLFYSFASGLLLYWTATNVCQIFEQWIVAKKVKSRA